MTGFVVAREPTCRAANFIICTARKIKLDVIMQGVVVRKMSPFVTD